MEKVSNQEVSLYIYTNTPGKHLASSGKRKQTKNFLSPGGCCWRVKRRDFEREWEAVDFHHWVSDLPTSPDWHQADVQGEVPYEAEHPGKHFRGRRGGKEETRGGEDKSAGKDQLRADTLVRLSTSGSDVWYHRCSHRLPRLCHRIQRLAWLKVFSFISPFQLSKISRQSH